MLIEGHDKLLMGQDPHLFCTTIVMGLLTTRLTCNDFLVFLLVQDLLHKENIFHGTQYNIYAVLSIYINVLYKPYTLTWIARTSLISLDLRGYAGLGLVSIWRPLRNTRVSMQRWVMADHL